MLESLLAEIRSGGVFEIGTLADKLGTTPELVAVMLEHLQRAGYLHPYQACDVGCGNCSLKKIGCHSNVIIGIRIWKG